MRQSKKTFAFKILPLLTLTATGRTGSRGSISLALVFAPPNAHRPALPFAGFLCACFSLTLLYIIHSMNILNLTNFIELALLHTHSPQKQQRGTSLRLTWNREAVHLLSAKRFAEGLFAIEPFSSLSSSALCTGTGLGCVRYQQSGRPSPRARARSQRRGAMMRARNRGINRAPRHPTDVTRDLAVRRPNWLHVSGCEGPAGMHPSIARIAHVHGNQEVKRKHQTPSRRTQMSETGVVHMRWACRHDEPQLCTRAGTLHTH
jgi:hypothetical protein